MENYKPNSHRYKEGKAESTEPKNLKKIATSGVKTKKKSEISKFADVFIADDVSKVKSYVLMDVIIPAAKKLISDVVIGGIDILLYGGTGRVGKNGKTPYVSYSGFSSPNKVTYGGKTENTNTVRNRFDFDELELETRGQAEALKAAMLEAIEEYGLVTVADMYDMVNLTQPHTSNKYGWMSANAIRNAQPTRVIGGGYVLKLPKPMPID